jgi:hypothetical protein
MIATATSAARSCFHCVLGRVLTRHRASGSRIRVSAGISGPLWLPVRGMRLYRAISKFIAQLVVAAGDREIRVAVVNPLGRSHIELLGCLSMGRHGTVFACRFPRHVEAMLVRGFFEGL